MVDRNFILTQEALKAPQDPLGIVRGIIPWYSSFLSNTGNHKIVVVLEWEKQTFIIHKHVK